MKLDLTKLNYNDSLNILEKVNLDVIDNREIKDLKDLLVSGKAYYSVTDELIIELNLKGIMVITDSYTLDLVDYPFNTEIELAYTKEEQNLLKKAENNENILDITEILWQNIVLEVPISYTKNTNYEKISGDGWELVDKNTKKIDSRLAKLNELLEKGKE